MVCETSYGFVVLLSPFPVVTSMGLAIFSFSCFLQVIAILSLDVLTKVSLY